LLRTIVTLSLSCLRCRSSFGAVPDAPSGFDPGLERRAEYVGILLSKGRSRRSLRREWTQPVRRAAARHRGAGRGRSTRSQAVARSSPTRTFAKRTTSWRAAENG